MTGVTEGIGGTILPDGMTLRVIGPVSREALEAAQAERRRLAEQDAIRRIGELDRLHFPAVMIWDPSVSASGEWDALGDGWPAAIQERSPVAFLRRLQATLPPVIRGSLPEGYCLLCKRPAADCRCDALGRPGGQAPAAGAIPGVPAAGAQARWLAGVVRQRMNNGRLLPGDRLTAEAVAARHHVAQEVADAALSLLVGEGRVRQDGSGNVVTGRPEGDPDTAPFRPDEFTYRAVADRLAVRIKAGEFGEPGKLPGAAAIAAHYGVGPAVVRHARQELTERGLIRYAPGTGTFVV